MMKKKLLYLIHEKIMSGMDPGNHEGLSGGKMGVALFLYEYSWLKQSSEIQEEANRIVETLWESIIDRSDLPNHFFTGCPGIAWGLFELGKRGFLELSEELNPYITLTDFFIYYIQKTETPVLIDRESGLFTSGFYHVAHDSDALGRFYWREEAIYLIEDCNRLIYKTTSYQNLFLPDMTLKLLNSILYFLIEMHRRAIYPSKTTDLIQQTCLQIMALAKSADIQDVIMAKCLLATIDCHTAIHATLYTEMISGSIHPTAELPKDVVERLSDAGFYALLYHHKSIFEESLAYYANRHPQILKIVYEKIKNEKIPVKHLLGIGYGLLMMPKNEDEED